MTTSLLNDDVIIQTSIKFINILKILLVNKIKPKIVSSFSAQTNQRFLQKQKRYNLMKSYLKDDNMAKAFVN